MPEDQIDPKDDFNFTDMKLSDFKIGGTQLGESEPVVTEPVAPETPPVTEPVVTPEPTPAVAPVVTPEPSIVETPKVPEAPKFKDDFIKSVVDYYEKTGDLTPYLQAKLVDFNKLTDEDIMRRNLREQYGDLSEKAFESLYKREVVDKFRIDASEFSEDEVELGKELLRSESSKLRQKYIDWQNSFKAPEPIKDEAAEQQLALQQKEASEALEKFVADIKSSPSTKGLLEGKRLAIKHPDGDYNFEIQDANSLVEMAVDNNKFFSLFAKPEGGIDLDKWYKAAAYAANSDQFESSLINYGKTLGREEFSKEIKNPSAPELGGVPSESSGDFMGGLLNAFATRGNSK